MIFLRKFLKKSVNSMCLSCLWPFTKYPFVFFSRKYLRPGYGNKRRESWIQVCSKPKTYTRSNIGLSLVRAHVPIICLEIFCIKLHWILKDTFQSFTKFSDWIFLPTDFVFRTGQLWLGPMELRRRGQVTISPPPISNQNFLTEPLLSNPITFNFSSSEKVYV